MDDIKPQDKPVSDTTGLAALLESRLMEWEKARKPQELKLLECYQDALRIPRDDDTKGTGAAASKKARGLFIGSTRNKIRAARAKINDALFGSGKMPFDTEPTNEELAPFADVVEDIITEQLERMKFKDMLSSGVDLLATYGTGFIFGPFVRKETLTETSVDNSVGVPALVEQSYEYDCPYFELGNTLDVYPDPEARDLDKGLGVFWVTMESPHTVKAWAADKAYQNIDQACLSPEGKRSETGSEIASQLRGNVEFWHKDGRIKVARFFGKVPRSALEPADDESAESAEQEAKEHELVDVIGIMAGGVVVKVDKAPWSKLPAKRCVYEAVANEIWGVGVAENNSAHQKIINAAFRLMNEGKGLALVPPVSVDRSKFLPTENFQVAPGKVYQFKPGLSADERKEAITVHVMPDVTDGWRDLIAMSEQFSDDDTGITKYTQGDDASHLNKTASGISMIMNASSLPIKEVISHVDEMWIVKMIDDLVEWDLKYLEPETVQKIHGDKHAQVWAQIKQFGKSSFMEWKATGTSSFMQKEILTNKIRAFSEFALSNPATAQLIDARELLTQTWDVMEIGRESPIVKDDQGKTDPHVQQLTQQVQQMDQVIQKMGAELDNNNLMDRKIKLEEDKVAFQREQFALQIAEQSAEKAVGIPDLMTRFDAIEQMLLDVMHGVKDTAHLSALPAPQAAQEPPQEPQMEAQEPPGQPEPPPEMAQPEQPQPAPEAGFSLPDA